jgi:HK97 gp10 family phage protein
MADGVTLRVDGLSDLQEKLRQLGPRLSRNGLRSAVNAGAQVIRREVKARAPSDTGTMQRAIYVKQIREKSSDVQQTFFVGVRSGKRFQKKGLDAYYWRYVEFGTRKMAARPFIRPAFEAKKSAAVEAIKAKLAERIEKLAAQR